MNTPILPGNEPHQRFAFYNLGECKHCKKQRLLNPIIHLCLECFEYQYVAQTPTDVYQDEIAQTQRTIRNVGIGFVVGIVFSIIVFTTAFSMVNQP